MARISGSGTKPGPDYEIIDNHFTVSVFRRPEEFDNFIRELQKYFLKTRAYRPTLASALAPRRVATLKFQIHPPAAF